MHDDLHLYFGFGFDQAQRPAFLADSNAVTGLQGLDLLEGQYEGGWDGRGPVWSFEDNERKVIGGVVDKPEKAVGTGQLHGFLLDVVLFL